MRILLVDDHVLFREGLASLLKTQADLEIVGATNTVSGAVAKAHSCQPDLILIDFGLRDGTGLEATQAILTERPQIAVVFLTVQEDDKHLFSAIRSGAKGYLPKNIPVEDLLQYLRGVKDGEPAITPIFIHRILDRFAQTQPRSPVLNSVVSTLTSRELEVLQELANEHTNKVIASHLFISERTVKNHVSHILAKLDLDNRYEAAKLARRIGLTHSDI
jgi:DNA-binding NarL/FixJ family response regulator